MNDKLIEKLNEEMFEDVKCCRCGTHDGVYTMSDENGSWFVCNDCDLPIYGTFRPYDLPSRHRDEEYDD